MKVAIFLAALAIIVEASTASLGGFLHLAVGLSIFVGGLIEGLKDNTLV